MVMRVIMCRKSQRANRLMTAGHWHLVDRICIWKLLHILLFSMLEDPCYCLQTFPPWLQLSILVSFSVRVCWSLRFLAASHSFCFLSSFLQTLMLRWTDLPHIQRGTKPCSLLEQLALTFECNQCPLWHHRALLYLPGKTDSLSELLNL